ncbi:superfamily I DNA/RNA helicase [Nitzschia inconspicua]|uniref:Superfamily I DNA/RNA helicase n=1 Tax=Nitzschia inconspicua TaxID=303405 RepID=A0A9K3KHV3_9STRA|nr:superfamily I DNA/RNA helicase [Nitzschia inconspicua]
MTATTTLSKMKLDSARWTWFLMVIIAVLLQHNGLITTTSFLCCHGLSLSSFSHFHGLSLQPQRTAATAPSRGGGTTAISSLTMRKQKASDRRTRRMQRGGDDSQLTQALIRDNLTTVLTRSPMAAAGGWKQRQTSGSIIDRSAASASSSSSPPPPSTGGGRGRSRKRSTLYNSLSSYHNKFLQLLTAEYRAEEEEVMGRIEASLEDPLGLENAGHALYDMYAERRGNLFADEIYRLVKARDATQPELPVNTKFSNNDVILLTLQPLGSGDIFDPKNLPTSGTAVSAEARVISTGPTYVDIVMPAGSFEANFGPAPNNEGPSGKGNEGLRLRIDRFFSEIPYKRMVDALTTMSTIPQRTEQSKLDEGDESTSKKNTKSKISNNKKMDDNANPHNNICMDEVLREAIISTHAFTEPSTPLFQDAEACDLQTISRLLAKPPMPSSITLANQVLTYIQGKKDVFQALNGPQLAAIGAALTRKLTLIQGPPGTGKTHTASVIGFGFTHQCRSISKNAKVLACAFSNVGADNLAEGFLKLGLKVVRVGKASAVSESLWGHTLDAAIQRDPDAQKALNHAATATAELMKIRKDKKRKTANGILSERLAQEMATAAVKQSIKASNIAATKAMREADIIVATSTGAADPRLMAACGLNLDSEELLEEDGRLSKTVRKNPIIGLKKTQLSANPERSNAPDGLPPLSLPFVIIDEACQSVEPGSLIPLTSSNSCRSLVLLGDPCQLPATVKSDSDSPLSISLMERLAGILPAPMIKMKDEHTEMDRTFIDALPVKQAKSLLHAMNTQRDSGVSYRKRFAGSLLLGVQYRMHPSIASFSSAIFYDGLLSTPAFLSQLRPFPPVLNEIMPCGNPSLGVRMINVGGKCNEMRGETNKYTRTTVTTATSRPTPSAEASSTFQNEAEAFRVVTLIKQILLFDQQYNLHAGTKIGVVTPYNGQVQLIKSMLARDEEFDVLTKSLSSTVEVNSVDGYQGRERDIIIFSAVRSNRRGNVGFLSDWRRLNVALTRAKSALLVVGDMETLAEGDKHWAAFLKWCQGVRCIMDDTESDDCNSL